MRLLLLSNTKNPGAPALAHAEGAIKDLLGARRRSVLYVPYATVMWSWDESAVTMRAVFERMGLACESVHTAADPAAAVERAEAVFVGGGNTFQLLRALYDTRLISALRERVRAGMPYIGASAGTNVVCPTIKTTNDMPIIEPPTFDALSLVPFQINPHYTEARLEGHGGETRDDRIAEFLRVNPGVYVVGLREGTMLRVDGSEARLIGARTARVFYGGRASVECGAGDSLEFLFS
ncbi:MAG TPA: dipeptidase PepE [Pyrinomonadaceae bacterium]